MTDVAPESADHAARERGQEMRTSTFRLVAGFIVLLALVVRVGYVDTAVVDFPIRGDVNAYVLHAWNLVHRGEFSTRLPEGGTSVKEDHRGPGYSLVLAGAMLVAGHSDLPLREGPDGWAVIGFSTDTWMRYVYAIQAILGALTVLLSMAIARFWLTRGMALVAGVLIGMWPHLVVATGALYSEAVFAFIVALSIYLLLRALFSRNARTAAVAGVSFGVASCVNPVIILFAVVMTGLLWRSSTFRCALIFLCAVSVLPLIWQVSTSTDMSALQSRASGPFVVGSWPEFYAAYDTRSSDEHSAEIMAAYNEEQQAFDRNASDGLRMMMDRMSLHPAHYLQWYVLSKPYLLWDWGVRIGAGEIYVADDVYTVETRNSFYRQNAFFRASESIYRTLNPLFFFFALVAGAMATLKVFRHKSESQWAVFVVAALFFYVTFVYSVLQAEPRYSIPFRPFEILLSLTLLAWLWQKVAAARNQAGMSGIAGS